MSIADLVIIGVMLVSGVLALMRGVTREVFSVVSWVGASFITYWLFPPLQPTGRALLGFLPNIGLIDFATGMIIFIVALVGFSYITGQLTDKLRGADKPGAFDGTAGFVFGIARGFLLVCVTYLAYTLFTQPRNHPDWIANSFFLPYINDTNEAFLAFVSDAEKHIPANPVTGGGSPRSNGSKGYADDSRSDMDRLIDNRAGKRR